MKKLYALTMLFSVASLQASDHLTALVQTIKAINKSLAALRASLPAKKY